MIIPAELPAASPAPARITSARLDRAEFSVLPDAPPKAPPSAAGAPPGARSTAVKATDAGKSEGQTEDAPKGSPSDGAMQAGALPGPARTVPPLPRKPAATDRPEPSGPPHPGAEAAAAGPGSTQEAAGASRDAPPAGKTASGTTADARRPPGPLSFPPVSAGPRGAAADGRQGPYPKTGTGTQPPAPDLAQRAQAAPSPGLPGQTSPRPDLVAGSVLTGIVTAPARATGSADGTGRGRTAERAAPSPAGRSAAPPPPAAYQGVGFPALVTGPQPIQATPDPSAALFAPFGPPLAPADRQTDDRPELSLPAPLTAPGTGPARPCLPALSRHAASQIVAALTGAVEEGQRITDLTLDPEELGRVRLRLAAGDGVLTVTVIAERGETMDLLRRNIDLLTGELHRIGYARTEFVFAQGHPLGQEHPYEQAHPGADPDAAGPETAAPAPALRIVLGDRLDIRV